ncbi:hypothetical protein [Paucibacter sp. KCTC 42545]|uniref:hypothetical protein n=1 Tax=Paucibacter sp. KCTC 42545 TaxID=1768242 RepID=UPI000B30AABE|nr:hypothetical protein [Paucibacter sp. KCTC 42545]
MQARFIESPRRKDCVWRRLGQSLHRSLDDGSTGSPPSLGQTLDEHAAQPCHGGDATASDGAREQESILQFTRNSISKGTFHESKVIGFSPVGASHSAQRLCHQFQIRAAAGRSGCTQVSEGQGCDIHKTKAENAKAGFVNEAAAPAAAAAPKASPTAQNPYAGQWVAKSDSGATVATIRIDAKEHVWVNGKKVKAKRSDGGLTFKTGTITYRIQGDRRLKGEDTWTDSDAGTKGQIVSE